MKQPGSFGWRWRRFCAMPWGEVAYRIWQRAWKGRIRRQIQGEVLPASLGEIVGSADTRLGQHGEHTEATALSATYLAEVMAAGEEVCTHRMELFGRRVSLGEEVDWYRDYLHDAQVPRVPYWELQYRNPEADVDIMAVWWLNRQQHLVPAAIAYYVTGNESYAEEVVKQVESWLTACEYPRGPGWLTGIEVAVRLITWAWLYRFLFARGRARCCSDAFLLMWFRVIRQHVRYITSHWSKYSSANNHVIAEAVAVLVATATWSALFEGGKYRQGALRRLVREVRRQVSEDGVDMEQSTSYQAFVLELLVNAAVVDEEARKQLSATIEKMADFLEALSCEVEEAPEVGDSDWGVASGILRRGPRYYQQVVAAARGVCGGNARDVFGSIESPVFWYSGRNESEERAVAPMVFRHGGYVVWNGIAEDDLPVKICVDVGPLGLGTLAAHGHADALSMTVHVKGEAVVVDPGTYTYHRELRWRAYFRGTRAHSTVRVGGCDQARMDGPFLWGCHYDVVLSHAVVSEDQFDVLARHNGYLRKFGVWHERRVAWHPLRGEWVIEDRLEGARRGNVPVEVLFHVHPQRRVEQESERRFVIYGTGYRVVMDVTEELAWRVVMGETEPPLGWYSWVLGEKEPCAVIVGSGGIEVGEVIQTLVKFEAQR